MKIHNTMRPRPACTLLYATCVAAHRAVQQPPTGLSNSDSTSSCNSKQHQHQMVGLARLAFCAAKDVAEAGSPIWADLKLVAGVSACRTRRSRSPSMRRAFLHAMPVMALCEGVDDQRVCENTQTRQQGDED